MTQYDPLWGVYVVKSLAKHFKTNLPDGSILFVEGEERATEKEDEFFELRMDGPVVEQFGQNNWRLYFEFNMLISYTQNPSGNFFRTDELIGTVTNLYWQQIPVYMYDENGNNNGLLGCLQLAKERNPKIQSSKFGKIRPDSRLLHATVEAHYHLYLD